MFCLYQIVQNSAMGQYIVFTRTQLCHGNGFNYN